MNWKENLARIINESGYTDRQIYAWTGISRSVISNMSNKKHDSLKVDQFVRLRLLLNKDHETFVHEIFGKEHFSDVIIVEKPRNLTQLGRILTDQYSYEKLPKKQLSRATGLTSQRMNYIVEEEDESIKIDELTKIEIALRLPLGTLVKKRFSKIKLNTQRRYESILKSLKD